MIPNPDRDDEREYSNTGDCHFVRGKGWVERDYEAEQERRWERSMARCSVDWPDTEGE